MQHVVLRRQMDVGDVGAGVGRRHHGQRVQTDGLLAAHFQIQIDHRASLVHLLHAPFQRGVLHAPTMNLDAATVIRLTDQNLKKKSNSKTNRDKAATKQNGAIR